MLKAKVRPFHTFPGCAAYAVGCEAYAVSCAAYAAGCAAYTVGCAAYAAGCAAYVHQCGNKAELELGLSLTKRVHRLSII